MIQTGLAFDALFAITGVASISPVMSTVLWMVILQNGSINEAITDNISIQRFCLWQVRLAKNNRQHT